MNIISRFLLVGALLAPGLLRAASFEGKVSFKMTTARGQVQEMNQSIKGDKMRIEMPSQKDMGGIIVDTAKRETTMIMDTQRMYMVMAMPDPASQPSGAARTEEPGQLEKTGETEKILGYLAQKYVATQGDNKTELWLAEGIGAFMGFGNGGRGGMGGRKGGGGAPAPQAWEKALAGKDLFPLRVVTHDQGGKENFRMEVTAIEKQSLSDDLFAPPAGYQKMDMGGMMQGMGGMPGMPNIPGLPGRAKKN
jgi:hypothetical protein